MRIIDGGSSQLSDEDSYVNLRPVVRPSGPACLGHLDRVSQA